MLLLGTMLLLFGDKARMLLFGDNAAVVWGQCCCCLGTRLLLLRTRVLLFGDKARMLLFGDKGVVGDKGTVVWGQG